MAGICIGRHEISRESPVFVVAELGANFTSLQEAERLMQIAASAGADAVKVQTFRAETLATEGATFTLEDGREIPQYEYFRAHEIDEAMHHELQAIAAALGLVFFSTPSDYADVDLLDRLKVPCFKTGSDDLTNYPLLEYIAGRGKPMIVSTGMSTLGEIEEALSRIRGAGNEQVILLHCVTGYPVPLSQAHLRVISTLQQAFDVPVGYSDHTQGRLAAVLGAALGAVMLEKHLALDVSAGGPDNDVAIDGQGLGSLVAEVRAVRALLGEPARRVFPVEEKWRAASRKSLVLGRNVPAGQPITHEDIGIRRPGGGLEPRHLAAIQGRRARRDLRRGEMIDWDAVE